MYTSVIIFLTGIFLGSLATFFIMYIINKNKTANDTYVLQLMASIQEKMGKMPMDMLNTVSSQLAQQNQQVLTQERMLTAGELRKVNQTLDQVTHLIREIEKNREHSFGSLSAVLDATHRDHMNLAKLTQELHSVIYEKQSRGQWGERMAEDILQLAGFQEGVNYYTQQTMTSTGNRPDFTFMLPRGLILNMDVKFPLENYNRFVNAETEEIRARCFALFIGDVKRHIKSIANREYISPHEQTVDYAIMFIPSDLIYTAIFQEQPLLLDEALKQKIVLCSPSTLYAVLAVIRQAMDNYALEKSTGEILKLMEIFTKEWQNYEEKVESLGKKIDWVVKEFGELSGVRAQKLSKPVQAFQALIKNSKDTEEVH